MRHRLENSAPRFWAACAWLFLLVLLAGVVTAASAWVLDAAWVIGPDDDC